MSYDEHQAFARLQDALAAASSAALVVAAHRPDQSQQWEKVAEAIQVCSMTVYKLAEESVLKTLKN